MEAKHTPGPWNVVNSRPTDALDIAVIFDAQSQVVCSIPKGSSHKPMQERRANARLIAAAPDMLGVLRMVGTLRQLGGMLAGSREVLQAVIDAADDAVIKATGSAS